MPRYSDLMAYQACPRLYAFRQTGYEPPAQTAPITTGQLVHTGIFACFLGKDVKQTVREAEMECCAKLRYIKDLHERHKAFEDVEKAAQRAQGLLWRYLTYWAKDYTDVEVEPELELNDVVTHPDLIAIYRSKRVVVDFKTGHSPDVRFLDMSGQVDLAAWMLKTTRRMDIQLVIYDIIADDFLGRHERPPQYERGFHLYHATCNLIGVTRNVREAEPYVQFDCPNTCSFFIPCYLIETGSEDEWRKYLEENYLKEKK